ncbi:hypothetical protein GPJ56_010920 [Histomonas meleagridis]|uniref:uncharacterized protein n=1 Tax=Histomonas meleagridis TaxID=135588 RepID=UPI003559A71C|nr:hypothetical protein GPJ56_010920 [Histomonas meleagridis]KAH0806279.1 hypothetical protein GO595_000967 [Histomonas meleagridis]
MVYAEINFIALVMLQHTEKLLEHARKITQDLNKLSVEFTSDDREKAEQKLKYAKKVLESVNNLPFKIGSEGIGVENLTDLVYQCMVSVSPHLSVAIDELEKTLQNNQSVEEPEVEINEEDFIKELEGKMEEFSNELIKKINEDGDGSQEMEDFRKAIIASQAEDNSNSEYEEDEEEYEYEPTEEEEEEEMVEVVEITQSI